MLPSVYREEPDFLRCPNRGENQMSRQLSFPPAVFVWVTLILRKNIYILSIVTETNSDRPQAATGAS